jgi:hypothetical protein
MTNEQIATNHDVLKLKAELFDMNSYMDYLRTQFAQIEKQRNEKMEELQKLINELQQTEA